MRPSSSPFGGIRCCRWSSSVKQTIRGIVCSEERLYALQPTIPYLTRSSLHRCLQRHDIWRLPEIEGDKPAKKKFKAYPLGYLHIDIAEVQTAEGKLYLFVAIDRPARALTLSSLRCIARRIASVVVALP